MAKKPTRLRFTEDDLSSASVSKAAGRADKAADKAEKAVDKLPGKKKKSKLRQETDKGSTGKNKLRFDKAKHEVEVERPSVSKHMATRASAVAVTSKMTM